MITFILISLVTLCKMLHIIDFLVLKQSPNLVFMFPNQIPILFSFRWKKKKKIKTLMEYISLAFNISRNYVFPNVLFYIGVRRHEVWLTIFYLSPVYLVPFWKSVGGISNSIFLTAVSQSKVFTLLRLSL